MLSHCKSETNITLKEVTNSTNKSKIYTMLSNILIGFLLIFILWLKFEEIKNSERFKKTDKEYSSSLEKLTNEIWDLKIEIRENKNQISQLRKKYSLQIPQALGQLNKEEEAEKSIQNDIKEIEGQNISEEEAQTPLSLDVQKSNTKLIYLPAPFEDRRFASEDVSEAKNITSLYLAIINKELNEGSITLLDSADFSRALNSPNIYLETACDYENAHRSDTKSMEVVEKGIVILEDNDWLVKKKIRIKFN